MSGQPFKRALGLFDAGMIVIGGIIGAMAAVGMTFAEYAVRLVTGEPQASALIGAGGGRAVAIGAIVFWSAINYLGVIPGSRLLNVFVVLKVAALAVLIASGLFYGGVLDAAQQVAAPGATGTLTAFGAALIPIVFAYGGWQNANYVAEEIRDPKTHSADLFAARHRDRGAGLCDDQRCLSPGARPGRAGGDHHAGVRCRAAVVRRGRRPLCDRGHCHLDVRVPQPVRAGADPRLLRHGGGRPVLSTSRQGAPEVPGAVARHHPAVDVGDRADDAPRPFKTWGYPVTPALFVLAAIAIVASVIRVSPRQSAMGAGLMLAGIPAFYYWKRASARRV